MRYANKSISGGNMIDIHCHILYGVDDGAEDFIDSCEMLRQAEESGITDIIATPHSYPGLFNNYKGKALDERFDRLSAHMKETKTSVRVHRGMEVYANDDTLRRFDKDQLMTLAGSRFMLIESAFNENPKFTMRCLAGLRERGIHPIVAHPERYYYIQDRPDIVCDWLDIGCSLQINAGSITGYFGRKCHETAYTLLSMNAVQFAAGDAHGAISRTPELREAYEQIGVHFSFGYADLLFRDNPLAVLNNKKLRFPNDHEASEPEDRILTDEEYWAQLD